MAHLSEEERDGAFIISSSTEYESAEYHGDKFGLFKKMPGKRYRQMDSEVEGQLMYWLRYDSAWYKAPKAWYIGPRVEAFGLQNKKDSDTPPVSGSSPKKIKKYNPS